MARNATRSDERLSDEGKKKQKKQAKKVDEALGGEECRFRQTITSNDPRSRLSKQDDWLPPASFAPSHFGEDASRA